MTIIKMRRIVKENDWFFPEYYSISIWGKKFSSWKRFQEDILVVNGIFSDLEKTDVCFKTEEQCEHYIRRESKIEVIKQIPLT